MNPHSWNVSNILKLVRFYTSLSLLTFATYFVYIVYLISIDLQSSCLLSSPTLQSLHFGLVGLLFSKLLYSYKVL